MENKKLVIFKVNVGFPQDERQLFIDSIEKGFKGTDSKPMVIFTKGNDIEITQQATQVYVTETDIKK